MFTSNCVKLQKMLFYNCTNTSFRNCLGTQFTAYAYHAPFYYGNIGHSMKYARCKPIVEKFSDTYSPIDAGYTGVYFGSGSTQPTKADYKLESPIESGLTITNPASLIFNDAGNGKYTLTADFIVRNTTETEIKINEVGVFCPVCSYSGYWAAGSSADWHVVLMERTVLSETISIAAGEAKFVTYRLEFNQTV